MEIKSHKELTYDSIDFITDIIAGEEDPVLSDADKVDAIKRNVSHLQTIKKGNYFDLSKFTSQDLAAIDAAIAAGNTYIDSL